ncbi:hypothetical protein M9H77_16394 [Catharanthus roseus]|uniref:Uncharacterized protein n=1 Tax=Catharanthus roseus TaxID=4058 RepID=A0ACC0B1N2_CATRO|nr:hypothetical protein M9H77_16394 [Catharanthus roseus]
MRVVISRDAIFNELEMPCIKDKPISDSPPSVPTLSSIPNPSRNLKPILSLLFHPVAHLVLLNILRLKLKLLEITNLRGIESSLSLSLLVSCATVSLLLGIIPSPFLLRLLSLLLDCWFFQLVYYLSSPRLLELLSSVCRLPATLSRRRLPWIIF